VADPDAAGALAARIRKSLAQPFVIENNRVRVTSSIGIALFSPEASGPETMMMQADLALYGAKDEGRNCYRFHSPDLDQAGARTRACGRRAHGRAGAGVISNSITTAGRARLGPHHRGGGPDQVEPQDTLPAHVR
jgi:hypothetical protein